MAQVQGVRPFVPSKDYQRSKDFYKALGFTTIYEDDKVTIFKADGAGFILQNFYVQELADNFMVDLVVDNAAEWWSSSNVEKVAETFATSPPTKPAMQSWGMVVGFVHDPSGVLWHVTEAGR